MAPQTYETTPTRFVEANGIRYAYRSLGKESGTPLVFLQHFRGTLDNWDPAVVNGLAKDRPVVLFDNAGIARSGGQTPDHVAQMARHALAVIQALGLREVDLLGFSLGGFVAQQVTLDRPDLVRRVILAGTGPQGGEGFDKFSPEVQAVAAQEKSKLEDLLFLFFAPTQTSQAAGRAFLERLGARKEDREPPSTVQVRDAQLAAIQAWGTPQGERYARLREIKHLVLVVNGNHDIMIPPINSYILAQHLPNAQLILYPDAGHGSLFQYPGSSSTPLCFFAAEVLTGRTAPYRSGTRPQATDFGEPRDWGGTGPDAGANGPSKLKNASQWKRFVNDSTGASSLQF